MLNSIKAAKILFLDIETVPMYEFWEELEPEVQEMWAQKTQNRRKELGEDPGIHYINNAGIWAEFGKIICISVGFITKNDKIRIKSFYSHNEKSLLQDFADLMNNHFYSSQSLLCGHNIKEFDVPFIARRLLINQIELPNLFNLFGKKPWEIRHLDTMELWKFGDYKNYTSLGLLAHLFGIETPKDDIDGSMVSRVYYKENNLERIRAYCEKDVLAVAQVFRKMRREPLLELDVVNEEN
ncbi:MAG: 3'-5' exonuclease [Flavobacteriaceae bacterium]|nr:3'-5' exonuclease [Flavobacteriaceae bacterium]